MGTLLHSCVEVHEPIELSFGVVNGISQRMGVLDGGRGAARGKWRVQEVLGSFLPLLFKWCIVKQKCIRLVCEKLIIFPHGQYMVGNVFSLAFW